MSSLQVRMPPSQLRPMKVLTLLIDNYDSYTYNIYQMLAEINGIAPIVIRNDAYRGNWSLAWAAFQHHAATLQSKLTEIDMELVVNIVISPGPGHPSNAKDFGLCADAIRLSDQVPVLGVCLGLQGLSVVYGGHVVHAPEVMHGRMSHVYIEAVNSDLWAFIPNGFEVVRYHSLVVDPATLPPSLVVTARTKDGVIMAMKHVTKPQYGVQFHPEAICSTFGYQLFQNFRDITTNSSPTICLLHHRDHASASSIVDSPVVTSMQQSKQNTSALTSYVVRIDKVDTGGIASISFAHSIFNAIYRSARRSFWLDSSNHIDQTSACRFSYMGDNRGPHSYCVEYSVAKQQLQIYRNQLDGETCDLVCNTDLLSHIRDTMAEFQSYELVTTTEEIPFTFRGGFVGFLGYEALDKQIFEQQSILDEAVPDASFLFADRALVFDHKEGYLYSVSVSSYENQSHSIDWHKAMKERLVRFAHAFQPEDANLQLHKSTHQTGLVFHPSRSRQQYHNDIHTIQEHIHAGDTYEVCLTNQLYADRVHLHDPFAFYTELRTRNPAPFAAFYLSNPNHQFSSTATPSAFSQPPGLATCEVEESCLKSNVQRSYAVCCSSPERFLSIDSKGWMESKPIKGTRRRGRTQSEDMLIMKELATCAKDRAENMMIVDLVRHDFGQVAEIASVHVPYLMAVESYATVHQLVTTVRAKKQNERDVCDVLRATFPGGSMTGAPKKRTMDIIRDLETNTKRGVYSGAMGFLSIDGSCDLNIVIRTAVITPTSISIGSGGAIVALSDADDEYDEMLLKTHALVNALSQFLTGNDGKVAVE